MISGVHALMFSRDADAVRKFLRDVLELDSIDAGDGWLIFTLPPAELGVHPTDEAPHHELYLMCDDVEESVARLSAKGVRFDGDGEIITARFGKVATMLLPDGSKLAMYEPHHARAVR
jgi:extradiol dioxygenase family protein